MASCAGILCAGPIGAASPPARYILSGICRASGRVCRSEAARVFSWGRNASGRGCRSCCFSPVGAASADDRRGVSCQSASYAARDLLQVLLSGRAFLMALYLAFCGALAVRGVFIHASVINAFAGLLRGVALLLRVVSMRGAAFAASVLGVCCCRWRVLCSDHFGPCQLAL